MLRSVALTNTPLPPSLPLDIFPFPPLLSESLHHVGYKELREAKDHSVCHCNTGANAPLISTAAAYLISPLGYF